MNIFPPHNFYPCNNPKQNCYPCPSWTCPPTPVNCCCPCCPRNPLFSEDEDCFTSHPLFSSSFKTCNPTCMLKNPISPLFSLVIRFIIVFVFVLIALALLKSSKFFKNFKIPQFLREIVLKFIEPNLGALDPQKTPNLLASTRPLADATGRFIPPPFFPGNNLPPMDPFFFPGPPF